MCGIIGGWKKKHLKDFLIEGLQEEEYRGYDACGLCYREKQLQVYKVVGRVKALSKAAPASKAHVGIAHTRWATHGKNEVSNAHPQCSSNGRFALVHNGTIHNYKKLKQELESKGYTFQSETDTEVIVQYLDALFDEHQEVKKSLQILDQKLDGAYALAILFLPEERIYFLKKDAPLLLSYAKEEWFITSDLMALKGNYEKSYDVQNHEYGYIERKNGKLFFGGKEKEIEWSNKQEKEQDYVYRSDQPIMEQEIAYIPSMMTAIQNLYFKQKELHFDGKILDALQNAKEYIFIGSGTSYHACLAAQNFFEKKSSVRIASEFAYQEEPLSSNALYIFVSQSGETADVLRCVEKINYHHARSLGISNVQHSSLMKKTSFQLYLGAKKEVAVASTKAYIAQVLLLYMVAQQEKAANAFYHIQEAKKAIEDVIFNHHKEQAIAKEIASSTSGFFMGRGKSYALALEASLKLKEVSYLHSEAIYSGELKHGPIALITPKFPIFAIVLEKRFVSLMEANVEEVKARGASVYVYDIHEDQEKNPLAFLALMVRFQYLAFYTALERGYDMDKPRNLAKSVTVE